jgi:hypothetical protein
MGSKIYIKAHKPASQINRNYDPQMTFVVLFRFSLVLEEKRDENKENGGSWYNTKEEGIEKKNGVE